MLTHTSRLTSRVLSSLEGRTSVCVLFVTICHDLGHIGAICYCEGPNDIPSREASDSLPAIRKLSFNATFAYASLCLDTLTGLGHGAHINLSGYGTCCPEPDE
ncbi:hypothetical protein BV25DRAFT_1832243 [Artomyces pyxidatus]|uniref:Uncharacterized protein n=1 Tax=Artomyces pyxidatus TaxID=48021 RepID=A0ACB8SKS7_9AGAM|nr:hypothetical protein BV25DRAFT_1832243 [Artomyces pyxidatus]